MKKLLNTAQVISWLTVMLFSAQAAHAESFADRLTPKWGSFDLKLKNTTAEKWKATWYCFETNADGSADLSKRKKIDGDTYPSSQGKTRTTTMSKSKCPSGLWAIGFEIDAWGKWRTVDPDKGVCGTDNWNCGAWTDLRTNLGTQTFTKYAPNSWFKWKGGKKACAKLWNVSFVATWAEQYSSLPVHYNVPNDKKFKTALYNCED